MRTVYLEGYPGAVRWLVLGALTAAWAAWLIHAWRRRRQVAVGAAALVLPVVAGCGILAWRSLYRENASYDDFKLLSVFYPGLLAGLCAGLVLSGRNWRAAGALVFMAVILAFNFVRAEDFRRVMKNPPLRVDRHISVLARIEDMPPVSSVNVRVSLYWARLWADAFLLRKPHYFEEATYEGRNVTPLRGEWDLRYTLLRVLPVAAADAIDLGQNFYLVRPASVAALDVDFGAGWNAVERFGTDRWRWTSGAGQILLNNIGPNPVAADLRFLAKGLEQDDRLTIEGQGRVLLDASLGSKPAWTERIRLTLPPGATVLILRPGDGNKHRSAVDDERKLGIAIHQMELKLTGQP